MKYSIEVASREEGEQLAAGLQDRTTRATVRMVGMLAELSPAEQERVLEAVGQRHVDTVRPLAASDEVAAELNPTP